MIEGYHIDHIDNDITNNRADNLQQLTPEEIKEVSETINETLKKHDCQLVPVTTIVAGQISTRIEVIKNKKESKIITPDNK